MVIKNVTTCPECETKNFHNTFLTTAPELDESVRKGTKSKIIMWSGKCTKCKHKDGKKY